MIRRADTVTPDRRRRGNDVPQRRRSAPRQRIARYLFVVAHQMAAPFGRPPHRRDDFRFGHIFRDHAARDAPFVIDPFDDAASAAPRRPNRIRYAAAAQIVEAPARRLSRPFQHQSPLRGSTDRQSIGKSHVRRVTQPYKFFTANYAAYAADPRMRGFTRTGPATLIPARARGRSPVRSARPPSPQALRPAASAHWPSGSAQG